MHFLLLKILEIKLPPVLQNPSSVKERYVEEKTSQVKRMPVIFQQLHDDVQLTGKPSDSVSSIIQ